MRTSEFDAFIAPATARPALWRLIVGLGVVIVVYLACVGILILAIWGFVGSDALMGWLHQLMTPTTPTATLVLLSSFIGMALGAVTAAALMHKRSPDSLFGPRDRTQRGFLHGALVAGVVLGLGLAWHLWTEPTQQNVPMTQWLMVLPLALALIGVQTGAEELLFRGYIQQQLAARFSSPLIWALLPSALFGMAHFSPATQGSTAPLIFAATGLFGVLAADLTARTGSIGVAWGFHFANNCIALLAVAVPDTITGLALYTMPLQMQDTGTIGPLILQDMAVTVVVWAAIRLTWRSE